VTRRTTITLTERIDEEVRKDARRRRLSVSEVIREALNKFYGEPGEEVDVPFIGIGDSGRDWSAVDFDRELERTWPEELRSESR
jgi:Arc/MetJ-type ribon-helix-helix transcriptional regulator